jgi:hypothetical protein
MSNLDRNFAALSIWRSLPSWITLLRRAGDWLDEVHVVAPECCLHVNRVGSTSTVTVTVGQVYRD